MSAWGLPLQAENVPLLLRRPKRWVVWRAEPRPNGKVDKLPYQPLAWQSLASTNNPAHWSSWEAALQCLHNHPGVFSGLGLVLSHGNGVEPFKQDGLPLLAIDLDRCDETDERYLALLELGCYVERSPSGKGYRGLGFGRLPCEVTHHAMGVEMYDGRTARYVTVTGHSING